jgi:hypothetical protein
MVLYRFPYPRVNGFSMIVLDMPHAVDDEAPDAALLPFAHWLVERMAERGVRNNQLAHALRLRGHDRVSNSMVSTWRRGVLPERENADALADFFGAERAEVWGLRRAQEQRRQDRADAADGGRSAPRLDDQLEEIRRTMGELAERLRAQPAPVVHAGALPFTRMMEVARHVPGAGRGRMVPEVVRAPHPLAVVAGGDHAVAWIVDSTGPQPGWWVRVGDADPLVLKPYEDGDRVTGVVAILQVVPHA